MSEEKIYSVGELISHINDFLKDNYSYVYVEGEISQISRGKEHIYISIKDEDNAVLKAAFFKWYMYGGVPELKQGDKVTLYGSLNIYQANSSFQIIVKKVFSQNEKGKKQREFEELKKRLEKEGLFDPVRKRPMPSTVRTAGVITSPDGAAVKDMMSVLKRRVSAIDIIVYPSAVQGIKAHEELIRGIEFFNVTYARRVDLIVITRGGGSIEDLWCFNNEELARSIFSSEIPVMSAVGHERDWTISDLVADIRAATPTAGMEMIARDSGEALSVVRNRIAAVLILITKRIEMFRMNMEKIEDAADRILQELDLLRSEMAGLRSECSGIIQRDLARAGGRLNEVKGRLAGLLTSEKAADLGRRFGNAMDLADQRILMKLRLPAAAFSEAFTGCAYLIGGRLAAAWRSFEEKRGRLEGLSPFSILKRGYSILRKEGKMIKDASEVAKGEIIEALLFKGKLDLEVKNAEKQ